MVVRWHLDNQVIEDGTFISLYTLPSGVAEASRCAGEAQLARERGRPLASSQQETKALSPKIPKELNPYLQPCEKA